MLALGTVVFRLKQVPPWTEVLTDRAKGRQKSLGVSGGLEPLHRPLASSRRFV